VTIPSFGQRAQAWASPPVDDIGYLPAVNMLAMTDAQLVDLIEQMEINRYTGWRNWQGKWRDVLGLDTTHGKYVLDYGCGTGIEAVQYIKARNEVVVADISETNVALAQRVCSLFGFNPTGIIMVGDSEPGFHPGYKPFDVIHCCGVLHHIPEPAPVVEKMASWLAPQGQLRLMVYSDEAWRIATGGEPPQMWATFADVRFEQFWTHWDPIGGYADWYDRTKLEDWFGEWFTVERCEPLTEHGEYLGAVLVKR